MMGGEKRREGIVHIFCLTLGPGEEEKASHLVYLRKIWSVCIPQCETSTVNPLQTILIGPHLRCR